MTITKAQNEESLAGHIKTYVGGAGTVTARRRDQWIYGVACNVCTLRWWREGGDASELIAAWLIHEAGHGAELRRRMTRDAKGELTRRDGEQNQRGISHLVALALVVMDIDVVRRTTILALLPRGGNKVGSSAKGAYKQFEKAGWITRFEPGLIRVNDRESLFGWVTNSRDLSPEHAINVLNVGVAAKSIAEEPAATDHGAIEMRRRELMALARLMERAPGSVTNQRGHVRIAPKSNPL